MQIFFRAFESDDYILVNRWRNDPEITELTGANVAFVSSMMEKNWVEEQMLNNRNNIFLAICLADTGEMIGYLSIKNIDHQNMRAEWGGIIIGKKDLWNKSIATKASGMMLNYVFEELNINLLFGFVLEDHVSSRKMIRKLGFSETGTVPEYVFKHGKMHNLIVIALLREQYRELMRQQKINSENS